METLDPARSLLDQCGRSSQIAPLRYRPACTEMEVALHLARLQYIQLWERLAIYN